MISIDANEITFFRTGIAFVSMVLLGFFFKSEKSLTGRQIIWLLSTGVIVGLHWITFFYSIKISTISVAVVCMSASTLFTSILEPIIFKRRYYISEFFLSIAVTLGVLVIFGFEKSYKAGIIIGLISAFLSAAFNTLNGLFVKEMSSLKITQYEMLGGFLTAALFLVFTDNLDASTFNLVPSDWWYLLLLALVCTTFAFIVAVWVMKFVTPFTVSISVNMEPVYTILLALLLDWYMGTKKEQMSDGFYLGGGIIIVTIVIHAWLKTKKNLSGKAT